MKTIGDTTNDGLLVITDTQWDFNGTLFVTVRELIGGRNGWVGGLPVRRMRSLARQAIDHTDKTRSAKEVHRSYDQGCWSVTFAVSRLDQ